MLNPGDQTVKGTAFRHTSSADREWAGAGHGPGQRGFTSSRISPTVHDKDKQGQTTTPCLGGHEKPLLVVIGMIQVVNSKRKP